MSTVPDQDPHARPDCVTVDPCDSNESNSSDSSDSSDSNKDRGEGPRHSNSTPDDDRRNKIDDTTYDGTCSGIDRAVSTSTAMARAGTHRAAPASAATAQAGTDRAGGGTSTRVPWAATAGSSACAADRAAGRW
ncbi:MULTISPECIES: hypothetical protein [Streptomyces]|uniref:Uncharacterized protein n=1 Tax=Streptomyces siderophoricus TaxID=2802281 RepID=A0ABS1MYI6_9ACTN|nr:hypothetical protein [Streptomyces sp. 9-7]MBL1092840.1 hypothetical protein [Streptomyces sp. 9-7]